ncbi:unnamed protein product [Urochloa decumbens]|uniref:F-box domain-containing protein n=1 Tax=Urochloa decumbens TaxID=240449 RepID=A0ABC8Y4W8_9POAL
MDLLPNDLLADVLARLHPSLRSLALSRCVCRSWRAAVDALGLIRSDLLPLSVCGIFVSMGHEPAPPEFFSPPSTARRIAGKLDGYVEKLEAIPQIVNCCNGLLLLGGQVVNPATRRQARLPPWPGYDGEHLAFDPAESPHYTVLLNSRHYWRDKKLAGGSEWPPSPYTFCVYSSSSSTGMWEERPFVREGGPAATVADVRSAREPDYRHDVYYHGALYVHCRGDFIMRITLSEEKYQVIKLPAGINASVYDQIYLGKSKGGVCCGIVDYNKQRFQVLFLNEFDGKIEWVLKHDINLETVRLARNRDGQPWILQDSNPVEYDNQGVKVKEALEWDSDNDDGPWTDEDDSEGMKAKETLERGSDNDANPGEDDNGGIRVIETLDWDFDFDDLLENTCEEWHPQCIFIFGFHPYKEVAFLWLSGDGVVACHLNSLKVQDLGNLDVPYRGDVVDTAFVYAPCWMGELSK